MKKNGFSNNWYRALFFLTAALFINQIVSASVMGEKNISQIVEVRDSIEAKRLCKQAEDYYEGKNGLFMNRDKAKELFVQSAEMNYGPAQFEIYKRWKDTDCEIAKKYLQKSAEQRYVPALIAIAEECVDPTMQCMEQSDELAAHWARIGAEMGINDLQFMLGLYYYASDSTDLDQAEYWFAMLSQKGDIAAQRYYGLILLQKGFQSKDPDKESEGLTWLENAALKGDGEAMYYLGIDFAYMKNNIPEAVKWLKMGSDIGNADSMIEYAGLLRDGKGVKKDTKAAFSYFLKAAELGKPEAMRFVAAGYWLGEGVKKNKAESLKWYRRAAENGDQQSIEFLNSYYK